LKERIQMHSQQKQILSEGLHVITNLAFCREVAMSILVSQMIDQAADMGADPKNMLIGYFAALHHANREAFSAKAAEMAASASRDELEAAINSREIMEEFDRQFKILQDAAIIKLNALLAVEKENA